MSEQELIQQARQQGATDYSEWLKAFWRRGVNGLEVAYIINGILSKWETDYRVKPSESSRRI